MVTKYDLATYLIQPANFISPDFTATSQLSNGSILLSTTGAQSSNGGTLNDYGLNLVSSSGTTGASIVIDSLGMLYLGNYVSQSQNNPRWIPDRNYVDSIHGLSNYTFNNGLTNSSGTVGLGGLITSNTNLGQSHQVIQ